MFEIISEFVERLIKMLAGFWESFLYNIGILATAIPTGIITAVIVALALDELISSLETSSTIFSDSGRNIIIASLALCSTLAIESVIYASFRFSTSIVFSRIEETKEARAKRDQSNWSWVEKLSVSRDDFLYQFSYLVIPVSVSALIIITFNVIEDMVHTGTELVVLARLFVSLSSVAYLVRGLGIANLGISKDRLALKKYELDLKADITKNRDSLKYGATQNANESNEVAPSQALTSAQRKVLDYINAGNSIENKTKTGKELELSRQTVATAVDVLKKARLIK